MEKEGVFESKRTWAAIWTGVFSVGTLLLKQFGVDVEQELLNSIATLWGLIGTVWIASRTVRNTA